MSGVGEAPDAAAAHRNEERIRWVKRFRETVRRNRRPHSRVPVWVPGTNPKLPVRPVVWRLVEQWPCFGRTVLYRISLPEADRMKVVWHDSERRPVVP